MIFSDPDIDVSQLYHQLVDTYLSDADDVDVNISKANINRNDRRTRKNKR